MLASSPHTDRLQRLRSALEAQGGGTLVLNPGPTLHYLTGLDFHLMERPVLLLIPSRGNLALVLPELEKLKLQDAPFEIEGFPYGEDPSQWPQIVARALQRVGARGKIRVESRWLRFLETDLLRQADPSLELTSADTLVASVRGLKDSAEITTMRKAIAAAEKALLDTIPVLRDGMSERDLADELLLQLLRSGSSIDLPFSPIVSFGENSANPHATPGSRKLRPRDLILIDWGARIDGYVSDLTRVFSWGEIPDELQKIAGIVREANAAAQAVASPGVRAREVDEAARRVIAEAGYGERFVHRTGHGLGLEAHEEPYIRSDNDEMLAPGMAFTIEPGIYVPGLGGVRIEDDMVITRERAECLSTLRRDLVPLG